MKTSSEYRADARAALAGKWGGSALCFFVFLMIELVISSACTLVPFAGNIVSSIIILPISYGLAVGFLRQLRSEEIELGWLFENFNSRVWVTLLLQFVYTALWTLLLIIPGIIKSYSYAMTSYILHDEPELKNNEAIEKSMSMMNGHKLDLFVLDLTFLGWVLLSILTLGIGLFWVIPYFYSARAAFYEDLKKEA